MYLRLICGTGLVLAGLACLAAPTEWLPEPPAGKTWQLIWSDEFDGEQLDQKKWDIPEYKRRDGYWSRKAIRLDGQGHLVISALKDGERYLDGCVRTRGKFEHAFGYWSCRAQLQQQQGHWTAFWLMCDSQGKIGNDGRDGTEIDIMEKPSLDDKLQHALHWDGYGKDHKSAGHQFKVPGIMSGFHVFSLWWTPTEYIFYVDGKETWRTKAGGVCQVPVFLKLSDEIGKWAGDITKAKLPDDFVVDYVRVWDLVDAK